MLQIKEKIDSEHTSPFKILLKSQLRIITCQDKYNHKNNISLSYVKSHVIMYLAGLKALGSMQNEKPYSVFEK